jgi:hypothetical protein
MKSNQIELLPITPQVGKIYQTLYKDRLKAEDIMNLSEFGYDFSYLSDNFTISEEELTNV